MPHYNLTLYFFPYCPLARFTQSSNQPANILLIKTVTKYNKIVFRGKIVANL